MSIQHDKSSRLKNLGITIILTGLIAGTSDGLAAIISAYLSSGASPVRVFQFVASGALGTYAFEHETSALWGVLFHYFIATGWAALFLALYPKLKLFKTGILLNSLLYGLFVWVIMNKVVVPLSSAPKGSPTVMRMIISAAILVVAIGFPISLMASRYYRNPGK